MSMLGKSVNTTESAEIMRLRCAIYLTLSGLSLLLNGTFLVVLWNSWSLVKRKRITYHVANLALSDSLVGGTTFGYFLLWTIRSSETPLSKTLVVITWTATLSSLFAVSLMATERALIIKRPHNWMKLLPMKRVFLALSGNWCLTLSLAIIMHFYTLEMRFVLLLLFYIPILVTAVVYYLVYKGLWRVARNNVREAKTSAIQEKKNLLQRKVSGFVLLLIAVLIMTVAPSFLCLAIKTACELFELKCSFIETVTYLSYYLYILELTNFVINPFIYVWRINMYRKAFWKLFD